jgi:CBS domain-containing protein
MPTQRTTDQPSSAKRTPKKAAAKTRARRHHRPETIKELMRSQVERVGLDASANDAARLMWERDIGSVPVVDENGHLAGIVTDRDIAMAGYLRGKPLWDIPVRSVMTTDVASAGAEDSIHDVSILMSRRRVRRIPIVDGDGVLAGIVSLNDLAQASKSAEGDGISEHDVAETLRIVCEPRTAH